MKLRKQQTGSMLIEALVSILLFAIGILALMGLQASAISSATGSKLRVDAMHLANQIVAQMRADDSNASNFVSKYSTTSGSAFKAWREDVNASLPNAKDCQSAVDFSGKVVRVRVEWRLAQSQEAGTCHNVEIVTQLQ